VAAVPPDLAARIRGFLEHDLRVPADALVPGAALVTSGLVDSVGLVRLATLLERLTGIAIPDRDITADQFDTVERIEAYVRRAAG
jgi:acyl carrier protein